MARKPTKIVAVIPAVAGTVPAGRVLAGMEEQLERITAVLAAMSRRVIHVVEHVNDLFRGDAEYRRFYKPWLRRAGLRRQDERSVRVVSAEGPAVPMKLASTCDPAVRPIASLEAMDTITPPEAERAAGVDRDGHSAVRLPFRFVRKTLAHKPTIALIGDGLGDNVPIRRTIWMQTFAHIDGRDRFHVWLASRLDCWEAWGETARGGGGPMLTPHLFALYVADPSHGERASIRPVAGFL